MRGVSVAQNVSCCASHPFVLCCLSPFLRFTSVHSGTMRSSSQVDVLFGKAVRALPRPLLEAVLVAELDDPVVLRSFPLAADDKLGCYVGEAGATGRFGRHRRVATLLSTSTRPLLRWIA